MKQTERLGVSCAKRASPNIAIYLLLLPFADDWRSIEFIRSEQRTITANERKEEKRPIHLKLRDWDAVRVQRQTEEDESVYSVRRTTATTKRYNNDITGIGNASSLRNGPRVCKMVQNDRLKCVFYLSPFLSLGFGVFLSMYSGRYVPSVQCGRWPNNVVCLCVR